MQFDFFPIFLLKINKETNFQFFQIGFNNFPPSSLTIPPISNIPSQIFKIISKTISLNIIRHWTKNQWTFQKHLLINPHFCLLKMNNYWIISICTCRCHMNIITPGWSITPISKSEHLIIISIRINPHKLDCAIIILG